MKNEISTGIKVEVRETPYGPVEIAPIESLDSLHVYDRGTTQQRMAWLDEQGVGYIASWLEIDDGDNVALVIRSTTYTGPTDDDVAELDVRFVGAEQSDLDCIILHGFTLAAKGRPMLRCECGAEFEATHEGYLDSELHEQTCLAHWTDIYVSAGWGVEAGDKAAEEVARRTV